jgi:hypothetical protein
MTENSGVRTGYDVVRDVVQALVPEGVETLPEVRASYLEDAPAPDQVRGGRGRVLGADLASALAAMVPFLMGVTTEVLVKLAAEGVEKEGTKLFKLRPGRAAAAARRKALQDPVPEVPAGQRGEEFTKRCVAIVSQYATDPQEARRIAEAIAAAVLAEAAAPGAASAPGAQSAPGSPDPAQP